MQSIRSTSTPIYWAYGITRSNQIEAEHAPEKDHELVTGEMKGILTAADALDASQKLLQWQQRR